MGLHRDDLELMVNYLAGCRCRLCREWERIYRTTQYSANRQEVEARPKRRLNGPEARWQAWSEKYGPAARNRTAGRRRQARQTNAEISDFTADQRKALLAKPGQRCYYCGKANPTHADHMVPLVRGGNHTLSNIAPACQSCNLRKHAKTAAEFLAQLEEEGRTTR